jgi:putative ABC transport system permease protein
VQTTTEAAFNAQFVTIFGSVPLFLASIGGGVLIAILLAVVNTMLLAGREQTPDIGVLKALGFSDGAVGRALLVQSMILALLGGGIGILIAVASAPAFEQMLSPMIPMYTIEPNTLALALALTLAIGLVAGAVPAWRARGLTVVDALRQEV